MEAGQLDAVIIFVVVKGRTRDITINYYEESNLTHEVSSHLFLDSVALANASGRVG
jgi:hypothetical protein